MVCLSISVPERATIHCITTLKPFVTALSHELAMFAHFLGNPANHGFFVTDLVAVNLHGHSWERKFSFNISYARAD